MRNFLLALAVLAVATACAPKASGPPQTTGGTGATTSSAVSSPEAMPPGGASPAASPAAAASPGQLPPGHPAASASPGQLPPGHPSVTTGASPPPSHMTDSGKMNVAETEGAVVAVQGEELFLSRPNGIELKFYIPKDVKFMPEGKTAADLKEGTRVKIHIRQVERGMEADAITLEELPPAKR